MRNTDTNYVRVQTSVRRDRRHTVRLDLVGWHPDDIDALASYLETSTLPSATDIGRALQTRAIPRDESRNIVNIVNIGPIDAGL